MVKQPCPNDNGARPANSTLSNCKISDINFAARSDINGVNHDSGRTTSTNGVNGESYNKKHQKGP